MATPRHEPRREAHARGCPASGATSPRQPRHSLSLEPNGGTWIGINDANITFALINWYSVSARVAGQAVSRGEVVKLSLVTDSPSTPAEFSAVASRPSEPFPAHWCLPWQARSRRVALELKRLEPSNIVGKPTPGSLPALTNPAPNNPRKIFAEALRQDSAKSLACFAASIARTDLSADHIRPACTVPTQPR